MLCRLFILCLGFGLLATAGAARPPVTPYARMTAQLKADAQGCPDLRLTTLGKAAGGTRELWMVRVAAPDGDPARTVRILVLCRQHGDEPASTEAILGLIHRLAVGGDPALKASLAHVTLYLIPMVNPDGADANTRTNHVGANLNRDWGVFGQPETRAVAEAARLLRPHLVVDAHNWDGNDEYNADCLEVPRETLTDEGKADHALQQEAARRLLLCGYAIHPTAWGPDSDPRLAHRWFTTRHVLSVLVETHSGDPSDRPDFERRQGMYVALIHGLAAHYASSFLTEKPRLDRLESYVGQESREAALFPPTPARPGHGLAAAPPVSSRLWLWALLAYGLTLWAGRSAPLPSPFRRRGRKGKAARNWLVGRRSPKISLGRYALKPGRGSTNTRPRALILPPLRPRRLTPPRPAVDGRRVPVV